MNVSSDALNTKEKNDEHTGNDDTGHEPEEGEGHQEVRKDDEGRETEEGREGIQAKGTRSGSKAEKALELMKRKEGATLREIAKATDWQNLPRAFTSDNLHSNYRLNSTNWALQA